MQPKIIVVTGGVLSGLGKGITTSSIGRLLASQKTVAIKCDGYLNVDPGTMNPIEHGEVFVLEDGGEVDMDFGHYERFLNINCKSEWNLTSGKIFSSVISKERKGDYLGKTIQIYPHVVDEVKEKWKQVIEKEQPDLLLIEIGGTVGDDENAWFIEAARQLLEEYDDVAYVHLTYLPFLHSVGEVKTKPAQRDLALLRERGLYPDIVICRSKYEITAEIKKKLARMCAMSEKQIISGTDVGNIYEVPLSYKSQNVAEILSEKLGVKADDLASWKEIVDNMNNPEKEIDIAICGKYTKLQDSYASVIEALRHAGAQYKTKINIKWLETTDLDDEDVIQELKSIKGVIVPGGFGSRGAEGKIKIVKHAREHNIPYLGLCYGMQLAVIEFARNVCGLNADTTEKTEKVEHPVVDYIPEQKNIDEKGGTMRLGAYKAILEEESKVSALYNEREASERHRHRYEINPAYHKILQEKGLKISGISPNGRLAEYIEITNHPYFIATQAHPELTSRLEKPNPLFRGFIKAAIEK